MALKPHIYPEGCFFNSLDDIKGRHITVMGLGLNGGGEAAVKFLLKHGAYVIATDMKTEEQLKPTIDSIAMDKSIDQSKLTYVLGGHRIEDFRDADCVIKNPGVKIEGNQYLQAASAIETDISLFLRFTKAPVIAITGSKGKSSTVSAIHYGLEKAGFRTFLGGNITVSPLTFLDQTDGSTPVVLELSSWQLADLRGRKALKPHIALITKIVPDHQNWYHNMSDYIADKKLIFADQTQNDFTIIDADGDPVGTGPAEGGTWGQVFARETGGKVLKYSQAELDFSEYGIWQTEDEDGNFCAKARIPGKPKDTVILKKISVPGRHMRSNVTNAALVLYLMGVEPSEIISILSSWTGIPHRLQYFHSWKNPASGKGIRFYNDSCATVPEAAAAASQSFGKPVTFITGGTDKGLEFDVLAETLDYQNSGSTPVQGLYLLAGTGTDKLISQLDGKGIKYEGPFNSLVELFAQLKKDIQDSEKAAYKTDTVVFSPGATSFGMFTNEFDRGNKFMSGAKELFR